MGNLLGSNTTQWILILGFVSLTIWIDNLAYFLGLAFVLLLLWAKRWDWNLIGLYRPISWRRLWLQAIIYSIILIALIDVILTPVLESILGAQPDISALDGIRGNFINYVFFIIFMWVIAAFGEEFIYRGLLVERLGTILGNTNATYWIAVIASSVLFGLAHQYQGLSGMISTGLVGLALGILFLKSKNRLWLTILTHGVYDAILITLIYLDKDMYVFDLLKNMFPDLL
jgi:membrane protease YdiL (CAAX protease family)